MKMLQGVGGMADCVRQEVCCVPLCPFLAWGCHLCVLSDSTLTETSQPEVSRIDDQSFTVGCDQHRCALFPQVDFVLNFCWQAKRNKCLTQLLEVKFNIFWGLDSSYLSC